jgi:putative transposase
MFYKKKNKARSYFKEALTVYKIFKQSKGSAGARTISKLAKNCGKNISKYIASKLMKRLNLVSSQYRKKSKYVAGKASIVSNKLARQFNALKPNKFWCGDITEMKVKSRKLYLAIVMDLFSRKIIGFNISTKMDASIVARALENAYFSRKEPEGVMFHSDQGSQYTSKAFITQLFRYKIIQSNSRRGNCYDNSPVERFFRSLKTEWLNQQKFENIEDLRTEIILYILKYYNDIRPHSFNNDLSPNDFERNFEKNYKIRSKKT